MVVDVMSTDEIYIDSIGFDRKGALPLRDHAVWSIACGMYSPLLGADEPVAEPRTSTAGKDNVRICAVLRS